MTDLYTSGKHILFLKENGITWADTKIKVMQFKLANALRIIYMEIF